MSGGTRAWLLAVVGGVIVISLALAGLQQRLARELLHREIYWAPDQVSGRFFMSGRGEYYAWLLYLWARRWRRIGDAALRTRCRRWFLINTLVQLPLWALAGYAAYLLAR